jgi:hypothetical protein
VIEFFNFVHFSSAMSDNNIEPVVIWWWLRRREKRGQGENKILGATILLPLILLYCFERT